MSQTTISTDLLKAIYNQVDETTQQTILDLQPDLLAAPRVDNGWVFPSLNSDRFNAVCQLADFVDSLGVDSYHDTRLIEVINNTASGDEAGKGLYLHRQGGNVAWYTSPTKKGKAVRLVPVYVGTDAEQHLIDLGYTQL
jgi:hypothetical protein